MLPTIVLALAVLLALGCLIMALRAFRHKRLIDDSPTSKTQGVFIGLTELKGTAETDTPLTSHLAAAKCVQYSWNVDEHWSRVVTETYTDGKGHVQTRTRVESGWTTVAGGGEAVPFYLEDDTGIIRIMPQHASIQSNTLFDRTCSPGDPLYYARGPSGAIANSTHRRRFHETAIPLHAMLYVMGQARERQDIVAAEIAYDKNSPMFIISTRTEKQVSSGFALKIWLWGALGLAIALGGAAGWQALRVYGAPASWQPYLVAALGFFAALGVGWLWTLYNSFVNLHHRVEQAWSQVDVQFKRRSDLIPNLVQAVAGYRAHEQETQTILAEMRRLSESADLKSIGPALRATVERYPELKAGAGFLALQKSLTDTEQRIALARDYFNQVATFYNTRLQVIPDRYVGALARLHPRDLLNAADFERAPVEVKLAS